jgi:DNA-binding LacI/PurR family transcriptional regulator
VPIVLLNNQHPGEFSHSISIDNAEGTYQTTTHLLKLGHKRIGYVGDQFGLESDAGRLGGFTRAMKEAAVDVPGEYVVSGDGKREGAAKACADLLKLAVRPSAIVCYNDMTALGVMDAAAALGLSIPRELSVVGFDDLFFTSALQPPLTTLRQPKREMGRKSMELLLALLKEQPAERAELVRGELIIRGSTAAAG